MKNFIIAILLIYICFDTYKYHYDYIDTAKAVIVKLLEVERHDKTTVNNAVDINIINDYIDKAQMSNSVRANDDIRYLVFDIDELDQTAAYYKTIMKSASKDAWHYVVDDYGIYKHVDHTNVLKMVDDIDINSYSIYIKISNSDSDCIDNTISLLKYLKILYPYAEVLSIYDVKNEDPAEELNYLINKIYFDE